MQPRDSLKLSSSVGTYKLQRKSNRRRVKYDTKKSFMWTPPIRQVSADQSVVPSRETLEEDANKNSNFKLKVKNKNLPMCPLHVPGHDMNSCKVIKAQAKAMKLNWSTYRGSESRRLQFQGTKKHPSEFQKLNDIVAIAV